MTFFRLSSGKKRVLSVQGDQEWNLVQNTEQLVWKVTLINNEQSNHQWTSWIRRDDTVINSTARKVAIVEDDFDQRENYRDALEQSG